MIFAETDSQALERPSGRFAELNSNSLCSLFAYYLSATGITHRGCYKRLNEVKGHLIPITLSSPWRTCPRQVGGQNEHQSKGPFSSRPELSGVQRSAVLPLKLLARLECNFYGEEAQPALAIVDIPVSLSEVCGYRAVPQKLADSSALDMHGSRQKCLQNPCRNAPETTTVIGSNPESVSSKDRSDLILVNQMKSCIDP